MKVQFKLLGVLLTSFSVSQIIVSSEEDIHNCSFLALAVGQHCSAMSVFSYSGFMNHVETLKKKKNNGYFQIGPMLFIWKAISDICVLKFMFAI